MFLPVARVPECGPPNAYYVCDFQLLPSVIDDSSNDDAMARQ